MGRMVLHREDQIKAMHSDLGSQKRNDWELENRIMADMEIIRVNQHGIKIATILKADGSVKEEKAFECDSCNKYRPESQLICIWRSEDDWLMECKECRDADK